ncbi:lipase family protein [Nocardia gamkensis]|uniref:Lipase n=1 Tax=Nocardia gamkensis TaxID=352869 RepID=A0A7X6R1Z8_9NOCA|nr:lipase family protein [Nocardia gamkensis]NKY25687.1 lipase [Nocardia gamkensis]NQE66452.1 putative inactive lipase [Nocardia gamkensis]
MKDVHAAPVTAQASNRPVRTAILGIALSALIALAAVPAAHAELPSPDHDPFYAAPADLERYPNGAVLDSRPIALFGLPLPVSAWQVKYRSTDASDDPVADVATVMVPMLPWFGPGARPLLSYQVPEDSLGTRCAPSFALRGGWDSGAVNTLIDTPFMAEALRRGWAVVAGDYEGPRSRFLDGVNSGRGVLDGIRAARDLPQAGLGPATPVGAWGYSGGAFATLWAAQMQPWYAPDVRFAGITSGGVPADWPAIAREADGTVQAGLALLILFAIARNDPGNGVLALLNDRGRAALAENATMCGSDLVPKYVGARVDDFAVVPDLLSHPAFRAATDAQELGGSAPETPMYLYHSRTDDVIPVAGFTDLVGRYCAQGAAITSVHSMLPTHNPAAIGEAPGAMNFLGDRFAGLPVAAGCRER